MSNKTVKLKKGSKATTSKKNAENVSNNVKKSAELKYVYPKGMTDNLEKKTFRRQARAQQARFTKEIGNLRGKPRTEKVKEANKWAATIYSPSGMPKF